MLRYLTVTLSNPRRPELPPITTLALVVEQALELGIPESMQLMLQLGRAGSRQVSVEHITQDAPYCTPVQIAWKDAVCVTGAVVSGIQAVIGAGLAAQLQTCQTPRNVPPRPPAPPPVPSAPALKPKAAARDPLLLAEHFLDAQTCRELCDHARAERKRPATVIDRAKSGEGRLVSKIDGRDRVAFHVPVEAIEGRLQAICHRAFVERVEPYFGVSIESWEYPGLLYYSPGGRYGVHADAENSFTGPDGKLTWRRMHDRDISLIIYLNDEFTGGSLYFPDLQRRVIPAPGLLVAFPSTHEFRHGVEPTESGERFVLINWAKSVGSPTVQEKPSSKSTFMRDWKGS